VGSWEASAALAARLALTGAGLVVAAALGLKIALLLLEPAITFLPPRDQAITPAALELPFEEAEPLTGDGVRLHGWLVPGAAPRRRLTLIYFHGNAENIAGCLPLARLTHDAGYDLLLVDYRGYGRSGGRPSETGLYRDGAAALAWLRDRPGGPGSRVVLWGRSIGTSVAIRTAAEDPVLTGLILESGFPSAGELLRAGGHRILYALSFFASYRFDQREALGRIHAPALVIHGTQDDIVPYRLGRDLFERLAGPRTFLAIEGGGHNDLLALHQTELWDGVRRFLTTLP
jgi:uncharacterized protein